MKSYQRKKTNHNIEISKVKYENNQARLEKEIKEVKKFFLNDIVIKEDNITRSCDICNKITHRASYAKHTKSKKKHMENEKQKELIKTKSLFQDAIENKTKNIYNPKSLKQVAGESIKLDDKHLNI